MRALVLGSGGRESALAWALARSPSVSQVVAAPGNAGIAAFAECVDVDVEDASSVVALADRVRPDLTVIGPEAPLVAGVGDALRGTGRAVFGPDAAAAQLEGSKAYAKSVMDEAGVPTARWRSFSATDEAVAFMDELGPPYVVKADGLAAGKGVVVTRERDDAVAAIEDRLVRRLYGDAGGRVVIEEYLEGEEASLIAFSDGHNIALCEPAQDYKRVFDGDRGPNTGGMGSYSPVPSCPTDVASHIADTVIEPVVRTMSVNTPFVGALYAGLVLTSHGPRVLEFNARFGDPETQALLPRLTSDFAELCLASATGSLEGVKVEWAPDACVTVVLASAGYPGNYRTGHAITGLQDAAALDDVEIFHAGTAARDGEFVTAGGRVLAVSALAPSFAKARARAYAAATRIDFEGKHVRTDIALRAEETERGAT